MSHAVTVPLLDASASLFNPSVGKPTIASGDEANPTWAVKATNMRGQTPTTLSNVDVDTVTWTLNQPDEYQVQFPKGAYGRDDLLTLGDSSDALELQIFRNNDLLTWGPIIGLDSAGSRGEVTCRGAGCDWYLNRRFVDGIITNHLTNPDFESGTSNWTNTGGATFSIETDDFEVGSQSAKLVSTATEADRFIVNSAGMGDNGIGLFVTVSAWYKIESFTGYALETRGLYIDGYYQNDLQFYNYFPIDNATARGKWQKCSTTIRIPPNQHWTINVRCYAINGTIRWDDVKLVAMDSLSPFLLSGTKTLPVDIATIIGEIVRHVQEPSVGKSNLFIGHNAETTGVKLLKSYQFADHIQFDQAMREFIERGDGSDYGMDLTPTSRTYHAYNGKRGTDRHASVTLMYDPSDSDANCTDYRFSEDGGACITRQTMLGEDNGPDRETGEASDATGIGDTILQDVRQAPQDTRVASLQPLADERISRFAAVPQNIDMDLQGDSGLIPTLKLGDLVHVVVNDGYIDISGTRRIMKMTLDRRKNILTVTVTLDSLDA